MNGSTTTTGQSSIQFPSFDHHPHHPHNNNNNSFQGSSYHQPQHLHHQQQPYSNQMVQNGNPNPNPNSNSNSGAFPPPLVPQPLPSQMSGNPGGYNNPTQTQSQSFGQAAGMTGGYRSDYGVGGGNEQSQPQPQGGVGAGGKGGPGAGGQGGGGLVPGLSRLSILPEEGSGGANTGGAGSEQPGEAGYPSGYTQGFQSHHPQHVGMQHYQQHNQQQQHLNGMMAGPQGQGQTGYQAFGGGSAGAENGFGGNQRFSTSRDGGNGLLSPTQGHLQPQQGGGGGGGGPLSPSFRTQQTNGYRSPTSVASPAHQHQHVGQGVGQTLGGNVPEGFPTSASSVTPEQAARYGIAGLGTPLGSAGIGAWMDGVNAAGMKSGGAGGAGGGGNWLEASPLQQQQQQQQQGLQGGQGSRRSLGDRDGGVSPGLVSPGLNGGSGGAGPFGRDSRAGNHPQEASGGNWSGFPGNPASGEQGRNQQQQQQQQQAGLGAKPQGSRGSGGSVQGQTQSRPSSVGQQRQVSQAPPQQQQIDQQQRHQSDETVDGNNAGDENAERMIGKLVDDEVIPTAIVIKNIPFAVQKETLLAIIESLQAPLPYAFNYHHDNGVFRGLAFANFRHPHEADAVVVALNGYDISGRKLRVEYKKVLQAGEKERIEREKAIKRMRSMQFDRGQLPAGGANGNSSGSTGRSASYNNGGPNRQGSWSQTNGNSSSNANPNSQGGVQQNALSGIPASLLASMTPQQLQSLAASLPGGAGSLNFNQQGQSLTPPLTTQSQSSGSGGMVSHLSHVYVPQHVTGALIRERTESTNTTGSQNVQRDNKSGQDSALGTGSMQAMQQQHLQQLQNPDRMPSPALSLGGASHHGSSSGGNGGLSPSLGPKAFAQSQPMQLTASNPGSQTGYNDVDFNDPVVLDIFSRALMFKEDRMRDEFSFSRNLSGKDRRAVHAVGEKLGLHHYSTGEGSDRYVVLSKVDPSRNNPSKVLSRQTGRVQSMAAQQGSYLSPYSPPIESAESRPESPGLRIKKSMPNMSLLNGPTVSRDPHRLLNKRSSGNLRDYATVGSGQQSRRPFASHTGATGSSSFNNLFGNALGNGTFEQPASSPTSPTDPTLATQGSNLPGLPGGFVRQPLGPTTENKGFISRTQLRSQTSTPPAGGSTSTSASAGNPNISSGSLKNGVIGGQRALTGGSGKGDNQSTHTSGSSTIEEEDFSEPKTSPTDRSSGQA